MSAETETGRSDGIPDGIGKPAVLRRPGVDVLPESPPEGSDSLRNEIFDLGHPEKRHAAERSGVLRRLLGRLGLGRKRSSEQPAEEADAPTIPPTEVTAEQPWHPPVAVTSPNSTPLPTRSARTDRLAENGIPVETGGSLPEAAQTRPQSPQDVSGLLRTADRRDQLAEEYARLRQEVRDDTVASGGPTNPDQSAPTLTRRQQGMLEGDYSDKEHPRAA